MVSKDERTLSNLKSDKLHILSPFQGFDTLNGTNPGVDTPVCVLSHLWCFFTSCQ